MEWTEADLDVLRDFWYCRSQWLYYRTRSVLAAKDYEDKMTKAAAYIVDKGLVDGGPMPKPEKVKV